MIESEKQIIERLAYFRWIDGGCKEGTSENDWNDAVEEYEIMMECRKDISDAAGRPYDGGYIYAPYVWKDQNVS